MFDDLESILLKEYPTLPTQDVPKIVNALEEKFKAEILSNGLQGAIFGGGFPGGGIPNGPGTQGVSQVNNIFNNLRWYFISNFRQALSEAYCELGLIKIIVEVPVDDAFRGGVTIESKELTPEELKQLDDCVDREGDMQHHILAHYWKRLFGGAGLIILTDQDPTTPLDINAIQPGTALEFRPVDMWELYFDLQNTEGHDSAIQDEKFEYYSYYSKKLHKSRVIKLVGRPAPSFLRPRLRGWGLSEVESLVRVVNQYLKGTDLIYELLDEAKIDVFGIKNLTNTLLAPNGTQRVFERIQIANKQKNFQHALVTDAEDTYEQKTLTFTGLADVMKEIRFQAAAELRMPLTKVFGISASGFNSGEDDIEVYNGMIESTIRSQAKKQVLKTVELRCQQLFGRVPSDLRIEFKPLRVMGAEQEENVKNSQTKRLLDSLAAGAITLKEFRDACTKETLLVIPLDPSALPDGADQLGNTSGNDEEQLDKEADVEEDQESLMYGNTPSTQEDPKEKSVANSSQEQLDKEHGISLEITQHNSDPMVGEKIENPGSVDEPKWEAAKKDADKSIGKRSWALVSYIYKRLGGTFKSKK